MDRGDGWFAGPSVGKNSVNIAEQADRPHRIEHSTDFAGMVKVADLVFPEFAEMSAMEDFSDSARIVF